MQKFGFIFFLLLFSLSLSAQVTTPKSAVKLEKVTPPTESNVVVERVRYPQAPIQTKDAPNAKQLIKQGDDLRAKGRHGAAYSFYNKAYELDANQETKEKMNRCLRAIGVPVKD